MNAEDDTFEPPERYDVGSPEWTARMAAAAWQVSRSGSKWIEETPAHISLDRAIKEGEISDGKAWAELLLLYPEVWTALRVMRFRRRLPQWR